MLDIPRETLSLNVAIVTYARCGRISNIQVNFELYSSDFSLLSLHPLNCVRKITDKIYYDWSIHTVTVISGRLRRYSCFST